MKKIVILGSSVAGVKIAELIRHQDKEANISILCYDQYFPYDRDLFYTILSKNNLSNIAYKEKDFFQSNNINVFLEKKITRVNFQKKRIFADDKTQMEYDLLVLVETPREAFPQVKGTNKQGVYGYYKIAEARELSNSLPLVDSVIIQSNTLKGLEIASAIIERGKEAIIVSRSKSLLSQILSPEVNSFWREKLEARGLRFFDESQIIEVLGDSFVKAARLQSGKVIACQNVIFADTEYDMKLFQDLSLDEKNRIVVDGHFQASEEGVYAVDSLCGLSADILNNTLKQTASLEEQAKVVVDFLNGQERQVFSSPCVNTVSIKDICVSFIGETRESNLKEEISFEQEAEAYKAIFTQDNCLVGALLINREEEKEVLLKAIQEKQVYRSDNHAIEAF